MQAPRCLREHRHTYEHAHMAGHMGWYTCESQIHQKYQKEVSDLQMSRAH